jgi:hypothetical protein
MTRRGRQRRPDAAAPLFTAATAAYAANCALGASVALRIVDTRRFRWVHHALYIATCVTTAAAIVAGWMQGTGRPGRAAALALVPAAAPLAAIPYVGTHGRRHPLTALAASPFYLAGLLVSRRSADRK